MFTKRRSRRIGLLLILCAIAFSPASSQQPTNPRGSETPQTFPGQTATQLSDGRWVLVGGRSAGQPTASIWLLESLTTAAEQMPFTLAEARAHHSTTVLPDGSLLVFGGVRSDGTVSAGVERIDVAAQSVDSVTGYRATPRADHSATLLTDGRVLLVGGRSEGGPMTEAELLNPVTGEVTTAAGLLRIPRGGHDATLLGDGRVLIQGGRSANGQSVVDSEAFDPTSEVFVASAAGAASEQFGVGGTSPVDGAFDVPLDAVVVVRVSTPVRHATARTGSLLLTSEHGEPIAFALVIAEGGRLLFLRPSSLLEPGQRYTLSASGLIDERENRLDGFTLSFTTRQEQEAQDLTDSENAGGVNSPWRNLPPLQAPPGVTALAGQVLRLNGAPLRDVTLRIDQVTTRTDRTGRFLLMPLDEGHHELVIDGRTANSPGITYGVFEVGVDIAAGKTTPLGYTSWMPRIDTANAVKISSPTTQELVVTTPAIPGLELRLPSGTVIRDIDNNIAREVSITAIPVEQPPFPLPRDVYVPVYFTVQPGGGYVYAGYGANQRGARLYYPNYRQAAVGEFFDFWHYDPEDRGWFVYGQGGVSEDRRQIIPDPGVQIYEFTGAMVANPGFAPPEGPCPCQDCRGGDPVDMSTGLFHLDKTDLALPDFLPVEVARVYRTKDSRSRAFGIGASILYDMYIVGDRNPYTYVDIVHACGSRLHFNRISPGTSWADAIYEHTATPGRFYKAKIERFTGAQGWIMRLKDGMNYIFPDAELATRPEEAALLKINDRYGNSVTITRSVVNGFGNLVGNIVSVTGTGGSRLTFTYNAQNRITQIRDNIGRTVDYTYTGTGHLWKVTDAAGGVTEYTYDGQGRMKTIKDPRGTVFLTNVYDANGRVSQQTLANGGLYQFAYTLNLGKVTQADVTNPRGIVDRITFNTSGNWLTKTDAVGRPEEQFQSVVRASPGEHVLSHTDALLRRTDFTYDDHRNITSLTRLAGTTEAVTVSATYDPWYSQITSLTNELSKTTVLELSPRATIVGVIDPLGNRVTAAENVRGQVVSVSDQVGTTSFEYAGSMAVGVTNALGFTSRRAVDGVGRTILRTDALGRSHGVQYNSLNLPTRAIDTLGGETAISYDQNGNVMNVTDARQGLTTYTHNVMDQLESRTDPLGRAEHYSYDLNGNLIQFVDRRGQPTNYGYDALDRLLQITYPDGSTTAYTYDRGDRVVQAVSPAGTITLVWDGLNRLTSETGPHGVVTYTHDPASRRETMTVAGQPSIGYSYDDADRLTAITQGTNVTTFGYDPSYRRSSMLLPNGVLVEYAYDTAHRLTGLTYKLGQTVLGALTYSYDANGRRTGVGGSFARSLLPQPSTMSSYNAANQLTQRDGNAFTYDLNGNLTADGARTFAWDARNQLTAVGGVSPASYTYDAFGRRSRSWIAGAPSESLYDGSAIVQELSQGVVTANILNGLDVDEVLTRFDGAGARTFLTDALGSTVALTSPSGSVSTQYSYEAFGATSRSGEQTANTVQFTGRDADGTGLYYYRARYYDSAQRRFISEDPLGFAGGDANLYGYVGNDPTNLVDPSGLSFTSNWRFFWDWALGRGDDRPYRFYGPDSLETQEMARSPGVEQLRRAFYQCGCRTITDGEYDTVQAYLDTIANPMTADLFDTSAQVGGFDGARVINNGNGTVTFWIRNVAGTHSFFLHAVPNRRGTHGMMTNIIQTFQWTERINPPRTETSGPKDDD